MKNTNLERVGMFYYVLNPRPSEKFSFEFKFVPLEVHYFSFCTVSFRRPLAKRGKRKNEKRPLTAKGKGSYIKN